METLQQPLLTKRLSKPVTVVPKPDWSSDFLENFFTIQLSRPSFGDSGSGSLEGSPGNLLVLNQTGSRAITEASPTSDPPHPPTGLHDLYHVLCPYAQVTGHP